MFNDTHKRQDRLKIMCFVQGVNNKASGLKKNTYILYIFWVFHALKNKYVDRKRIQGEVI